LERVRPLAAPFYGVNRDGAVRPFDALIVINALNVASGAETEGDGDAIVSLPAPSENSGPYTENGGTNHARAADSVGGLESSPLPALLTGRPSLKAELAARRWSDFRMSDGDGFRAGPGRIGE
jgi:hypothetical protein